MMMRYALMIAGVLLAAPAWGAEGRALQATYGLFTGGVRMIDVAATFDLGPQTYAVRTDARTIGIFARLLPWTGMFETAGTGDWLPVRHDYRVRWRDDITHGVFTYDPPGVFKSQQKTKDGKTSSDPVDPEIAQGTRDLLSAVMVAFAKFESEGTCTVDVLGFDSDRSFTIRFRDTGQTMLDNAKLSSYTGPAHGCSVEVIPQKGKWPKKPRGWLKIQQQAKGRMPVIWLARPVAGGPVIPVRIDIHTKYGDVIAHLTHAG